MGDDSTAIDEILAANIRALDDRIQNGWTDELSGDAEELQLKRLRTLAQLARQYRLLDNDTDESGPISPEQWTESLRAGMDADE